MQKFLTIREFSDLTGLSLTWIRRQANAGRLPFVRDHNRMRFPVEEAIKAANAIAAENCNAPGNEVRP